jgi:hypothetical protein
MASLVTPPALFDRTIDRTFRILKQFSISNRAYPLYFTLEAYFPGHRKVDQKIILEDDASSSFCSYT